MSGTSLDGVDLVYAEFSKNETWTYQIIHAETLPYDEIWKNKLQTAHRYSEFDLQQVDEDYTVYLSGFIKNFIRKYKLKTLDFVASHGHTILHQPELGRTLQIGNLPKISALIGQTVVCDFRVDDVALGGQGAPLVPIGDELLFSEYGYCLNLGGFANLSFKRNSERFAYDVCPVNKILNIYAEKLGFEYDENGSIAKNSKIDKDLLEQLNQIQFYKKEPPKSLGTEWLEANFFPILEQSKLKPETIIATCNKHFALQIASQFKVNSKVLVTGGGAFNSHLISEIEKFSNSEIIIPEAELVNYKEALIFAFLGILKIRNEINVLSSVTGAKNNHSSGRIFYA